MTNFARLVVALLLIFGAYELHSIASTDTHNAYCSQISNAANNYMANPYLTKAGFKQAEKPLLAVLERGAKHPEVQPPSILVYGAKVLGSAASPNNEGKIIDWSNYVKQLTASYLVANNC